MSPCKQLTLPLAVLSLALTQCGSEEKQPAQSPQGQAYGIEYYYGPDHDQMVPASRVDESLAAPAQAPPSDALNDAQVATACDTGHNAAIEQSRVAQSKTKDARVKKFAQMMLADHQRAKETETAIVVGLGLSPEQSPLATEMGVESGKTLYAMRESDVIDRTYIDGQIAAEQKFLDDLDKRLIPSAKNPDLRAALETSRARTVVHLEKAREIKAAWEAETEPKDSMMPGVPAPAL